MGFYANNPVSGNSDLSPNTLDMSIFNIYLPEKSVPTATPVEERWVHSSLFSIKLQNGAIDDYLRDMEDQSLLDEKADQLNPKFSFFDQGYSLVEPGLRSLSSSAKLLLILSSALLLLLSLLLGYFFWQNQKQSVGIFRLLGGTKKQALAAVLLCALLLCALGGGVGGALGYGLADSLGGEIMEEELRATERDSLFQPYVLSDSEEQAPVTGTADPLLSLGASAAALLFPTFTLVFLCKDIRKEPRELLPQTKA